MSHQTADHPTAAAEFIANTTQVRWHDATIWGTRSKRDRASQSVPEWELFFFFVVAGPITYCYGAEIVQISESTRTGRNAPGLAETSQ